MMQGARVSWGVHSQPPTRCALPSSHISLSAILRYFSVCHPQIFQCMYRNQGLLTWDLWCSPNVHTMAKRDFQLKGSLLQRCFLKICSSAALRTRKSTGADPQLVRNLVRINAARVDLHQVRVWAIKSVLWTIEFLNENCNVVMLGHNIHFGRGERRQKMKCGNTGRIHSGNTDKLVGNGACHA